MNKHTAGPWTARKSEGYHSWNIHGGGGINENVIAVCRGTSNPESGTMAKMDAEVAANAELIARAPTLKAENEELRALNAELVAALEQIRQFASMPASGQQAHPISEDEFRARLCQIGAASRTALDKARRERTEALVAANKGTSSQRGVCEECGREVNLVTHHHEARGG